MITFIPIKTSVLFPPQQDLFPLLDTLPVLQNKDVLFITAKVLSIHQGRTVPMKGHDKQTLIEQESNGALYTDNPYGYPITVMDNTLVGSAGIDESNGNGYYILWPKPIVPLLLAVQTYLCKKFSLHSLGIVATDTHSVPLRRGVSATAIAMVGVNPIKSYIHTPDLFGHLLTHTQLNMIESISGTVGIYMGEASESIPFVIVRNLPLQFVKGDTTPFHMVIPEEDIYGNLLKYGSKK